MSLVKAGTTDKAKAAKMQMPPACAAADSSSDEDGEDDQTDGVFVSKKDYENVAMLKKCFEENKIKLQQTTKTLVKERRKLKILLANAEDSDVQTEEELSRLRSELVQAKSALLHHQKESTQLRKEKVNVINEINGLKIESETGQACITALKARIDEQNKRILALKNQSLVAPPLEGRDSLLETRTTKLACNLQSVVLQRKSSRLEQQVLMLTKQKLRDDVARQELEASLEKLGRQLQNVACAVAADRSNFLEDKQGPRHKQGCHLQQKLLENANKKALIAEVFASHTKLLELQRQLEKHEMLDCSSFAICGMCASAVVTIALVYF